ncbi:MAG: sigma 54-interacting transcriptional regulator [Desulfitobacteriia bacterium]
MQTQWFNSIKVKDVLSPSFKTVPNNYSAAQVLEDLIDSNADEAVITDKYGNFHGLVTKRSLLHCFDSIVVQGELSVTELMIAEPLVASPEEDLNTAREKMRRAKVGRLPVVDQTGRVHGVLTAMEVCNAYSNKLESMGIQLETIINTIEEAIVVIDHHCKVKYWNTGAEKVYEIKQEEIVGKLISDFLPDSCTIKVSRTGEAVYNEYEITSLGKHLLKSAIPFFQDQKLRWVVCTAQDVTKFVNLLSELNQVRDRVFTLEKKNNSEDKKMELFTATKSKLFRQVLEHAKLLARTDSTVLILGESGTGKELMSQTIHNLSNRRDKPFIVINCAAIPESLFESELFGYAKGAFTGAAKEGRPGKFELANGGSLFLDEIGELSFDMQAKLLRVLQEKTFYRVGGVVPVTTNTRIIAATNKDLWKMVENGKFREDLFYRLNVLNLKLPALRQRKEDIPDLINYFISQFTERYQTIAPIISGEVLEFLMEYEWRGNIRELRNFIERLVVLSPGKVLRKDQVIRIIRGDNQYSPAHSDYKKEEMSETNLAVFLENKEREIIFDLLKKYKNNKSEVAKALNIPRSTLYYRMKSLKIV